MSTNAIRNLDKIHPCKRNKIEKGLQFLDSLNKQELIVTKVVLFGSSIREDCSDESDIDMCLFTDCTSANPLYHRFRGEVGEVMDDLCDLLVYKKLNPEWKEKIDKEGVVVYERLSNISN